MIIINIFGIVKKYDLIWVSVFHNFDSKLCFLTLILINIYKIFLNTLSQSKTLLDLLCLY